MRLDVIPDNSPGMKKPWYAGGLSFSCTQCGNCCTGSPGYVWISEEEIDRVARHLGLSTTEVLDRYTRRIGNRISLREHRNRRGEYDCTFLEEVEATRRVEGQTIRYTRRICTIYPVRPLQCRTWPFWDGNLQSRRAWQAAAGGCPGMDVGRKWSLQQIEQIRTATDWPEAPPGSD